MHTRRGTEKQSHWRVRLMEKKRRVRAPDLQGSDLGFVSMIANTMSLAAHGFHASSFYGKAFKKTDSRRQGGMEHVAWKNGRCLAGEELRFGPTVQSKLLS